MRNRWFFLAVYCFTAVSIADDAQISLGKQIYLQGKLTNDKPLQGKRNGSSITGEQAACVQCHRPSGLGGVEGDQIVPPITGQALFEAGEPVLVEVDKGSSRSLSQPSPKYDVKAFAAALREGKHVTGRLMQPLMPRFNLSDKEVQALMAYQKTLSTHWSVGASQTDIHLATVITPEVSAERRKAFVSTLQAMVNQHNVNVHARGHHKVAPIERRMHSQRTWSLDVWELEGPSSSWRQQLEAKHKQQPAFAILSGLSDGEWQPVQNFCETTGVACWFPSIDVVPQGAASTRYSVYFSKGVALEAEVIAKKLLAGGHKPGRVVQIIGGDAVEQAGAGSVQQAFDQSGVTVQSLAWSPANLVQVQEALKTLSVDDALLLWLRGDELRALQNAVNAPTAAVYLSSTLAGDVEQVNVGGWRQNAWLVQRFERPKLRAANLKRFNDWIRYRQLPLVDEKAQSEAFFAVNAFAWMSSSMLNNLYSDYLIERAEATLSMRDAMQVQEEVQSMMMGGGGRRPHTAPANPMTPADQPHVVDIAFMRQRESTSIYPRLSLSIGQRFASKGAFVGKLSEVIASGGDQAGEWLVP